MKNINTKALMVITLMLASFIAAPVMVSAKENDGELDFTQVGGEGFIVGFESLLGGIFGGMGQAGKLLSAVFSMLFAQTLENFSGAEILDNVYALSASTIETYNGTRTFADHSIEIYTLPYEYNQSYLETNNHGYSYCVVNTSGYIDYEIEYGAAVTLILWDNDGSLITAIDKLVTFFKTLRPYINEPEVAGDIPEKLISEGIELVTWFLIHINDIFTGEELFALNPITWQKITLNAGSNFSVEKTWKVTGLDWKLNPYMDENLDVAVGPVQFDLLLNSWNTTAQTYMDSYVEWLLTLTVDLSLYTAQWTSFTFDLIQLWIKEFHIEIDVGEIVNSFTSPESFNVASVFQGLNIEFYLFTHHLAGVYLYNDRDGNNQISTSYDNLTNSTGNTIYHEDGVTPVQVVNSSEVTHRLLLNEVGDFEFTKPYESGANKFSWGLTLHDAKISPVPIGVDLESYLSTSADSLEYISFGFTFEPEVLSGNVLKAPIKLDQFFAPFNGNGISNNNIAGLDLAIFYVSTILHFSLKIDVLGEDPEDPTAFLNEDNDYYEETHSLRVGNYLGDTFSGKLEFVDIAGPEYSWGLNEGDNYAPANSSILPIALYELEANAHESFTPSESENYQTFSADVGLNISFNVIFYAVTFPEFNGGNGIWHDPTFSVFMVFEATGFWALILLIAGVGFVGIATILIKRRKDMRF